jgi:DNA-binding response OmpR family regulator
MIQEMEVATEAQSDILPAVSLGAILIIEDDPRMQKVLRRIFTHERYAAIVAGDGQTGLDLFRREQPLAVVLDLILPNVSGRELCQTFKGLSAETPIVVLSAITEVADKGFRQPSADNASLRRQ